MKVIYDVCLVAKNCKWSFTDLHEAIDFAEVLEDCGRYRVVIMVDYKQGNK